MLVGSIIERGFIGMTHHKLCIFDMDGTLVDTLPDITNAVNRVLTQLDLPSLPPDEIEGYVGQGARWLLQCALQSVGDSDASLLSEARQRFLPTYKAHLTEHSRPFPGVVETLAQLQQEGHTLTVCTNKPIDLAQIILQDLELESFFQAAFGGDSFERKKPDPMPLLRIMERFSTPPTNTVMVGDTIYDIQAGRQAGTWTCGISHNGVRTQQLQDTGAHVILSDFTTLPNQDFFRS